MRFPFLCFVIFLVSPAAQAWEIALVGGMNYSRPSLNPDPPNGASLSTKAAFDFGGLTSFSLGGDYRFETGLIRHSRKTVLEDANSATESSYSGWLIPLTFRFMRADFLGFGFGPYIGLMSSRTRSTTTYAAGGTATIDGTDPYRKGTEVGLRASLRIAVPVYHSARVILDGSYLFGITDLNKLGTAEDKSQDLLVLFGIQIPLGESSTSSTEAPASPPRPTSISEATPVSEPTPTPSPTKTPSPQKKKGKRT